MTTKIEHDPRKVNKASLLFLIKKEHRALVKLAHRQQYVTPRAVPLPRNLVRVSQATSFDPRDWKHWYHNNTDYIRKGPQPKIGDSLHDWLRLRRNWRWKVAAACRPTAQLKISLRDAH